MALFDTAGDACLHTCCPKAAGAKHGPVRRLPCNCLPTICAHTGRVHLKHSPHAQHVVTLYLARGFDTTRSATSVNPSARFQRTWLCCDQPSSLCPRPTPTPYAAGGPCNMHVQITRSLVDRPTPPPAMVPLATSMETSHGQPLWYLSAAAHTPW